MASNEVPAYQHQATYQPAYHQPTDQQEIYYQQDYHQQGYQEQIYQQQGYQPQGDNQQIYQQPIYQDSNHQYPGYQQTGYQQPAYQEQDSQQSAPQEHIPPAPHALPSRSFYYRSVRFAFRLGEWWVPEIVSFAISGALFGVYWHLLNVYNGQPISDWEQGSGVSSIFVTLPSAISFLTTLMRGAMVFPVASAIGQWKWHQYSREPRRLAEFDHFDKASRGITGSIAFIFSRNFWSPASVGCLIMITSLFFGPFLQNTVRQELQFNIATNETAYLPVTSEYLGSLQQSNTDDPRWLVAPVAIQATIGRAWFFGHSLEEGGPDMSSQLHAECPTNDCSWDSFSTLGLLRWCEHADFEVEEVEFGNGTIKVATSVAAGVTSTRPHPDLANVTMHTILNMKASRTLPESSYFRDYLDELAVLAHLGVMGNFEGDGSDFHAMECILYWGAYRGYSNYTNGNLTEYTADENEIYSIPEREGNPLVNDFGNVTIKAPWRCDFNGSASEGSGSSESCVYHVAENAQHGLYNTLWPYLDGWTGNFRASESQATEGSVAQVWQHSNLFTDIFFWGWNIERSVSDDALMDMCVLYFSNLAFFLTSAFRVLSPDKQMATGEARIGLVHFKVNRRFLILPGAMLALSVIFFAVAVAWTWREQAWRNSQLPLLYHGLESTGPQEWRTMRMTSMWEDAYDTKAKLQIEEAGDGTRLQRYQDNPDAGQAVAYASVAENTDMSEETAVPRKGTWVTAWSKA